MSFVYAEKLDNRLDIHCDTKVGLESTAGASFSNEQIDTIIKYGIVKISLICPEIAIAFAGNNIGFASKLFNQLNAKRVFSIDELLDMAYCIHMNGKDNDVEFIVASCQDEKISLHCIKDHKITKDCMFAWIGSNVAHREFQAIRNTNNKGKASDRTSMAFLNVVQSCTDETVGGFHISAGYNPTTKSIGYRECKTFQTTKLQSSQPGETMRFYLDTKDGGFSYEQIPLSCDSLVLKIDQMEPSILYSRRFRMNEKDVKNPHLNSLMLPMLIIEDSHGNWIRV